MMLYLAPSLARVSVKPTWPSLAASLVSHVSSDTDTTHTRVVSLTEATEQTGGRSSVHNTAILLFTEVGPGGSSTLVGTIGVDLVDQIPVLILHILKADIAQDTGVVNQDVDAAEVLDSGVDDAFTVLDAIVVGNGLAAGSSNLVDYNVRGLFDQLAVMRTVMGRFGLPWRTCPRRSASHRGRSRRH